MVDLPAEMDLRIRALEARVFSLSRLGLGGAVGIEDTNACTNCNTNGCTNCVANELVGVLLPGEDRPLTGREITRMLAKVREG